jgi:hypothetical protein
MPAFARTDESQASIDIKAEGYSLLKISRQPYSRSSPIPQFTHNLIAILESLSNSGRVVSTRSISGKSLLFDFLLHRNRNASLLWENERFPGETLKGFPCAVEERRGHDVCVRSLRVA